MRSVADRPHGAEGIRFHLAEVRLGVAAGGALPVSGEVGKSRAGLDRLFCHDLALVLFQSVRVYQDRVVERLGLSDSRVIDMTAHHAHILVHCDNLVYCLHSGM